ncbi:zinc finger protein 431-like [Aphis craccivora]|uniref:Zinc finger protein 431-like n=1 Tax=Aphis craccivora TaxID=307492 RepID=A0A6G0W4Z9_APHCR|nr:zinc finger protein 431-like [Aphis craccivora]
MHFRKRTAIVFIEFVSHYLGSPVNEVKPKDLLWYSQHIRSTCTQRGALTNTVLCIFRILFREDPKSAHVNDLVDGWIRRGSPLVNILYNTEHKCANKKTELRQEDFHAYNIK